MTTAQRRATITATVAFTVATAAALLVAWCYDQLDHINIGA